MAEAQIMVQVQHIRSAKLCARGARQWFTRHGLDFTTFITKGYPVEVIEDKDAFGKLVADIARKDAAGELDE